MSDKEKCGNCKFFTVNEADPNYGMCQHDPPTHMWVPAQVGKNAKGEPELAPHSIGSGWPPTQYKLWCGQWQKGSIVKVAQVIPPLLDFPGGQN